VSWIHRESSKLDRPTIIRIDGTSVTSYPSRALQPVALTTSLPPDVPSGPPLVPATGPLVLRQLLEGEREHGAEEAAFRRTAGSSTLSWTRTGTR
jgi:hypothetical protein